MPRCWYVYNGGTPVTAAGSWNLLGCDGAAVIGCEGPATLCVISVYVPVLPAPATPFAPLSPNIRNYINSALVTSSNSIPQIGIPYLYKKAD